MPVPLPTNLSSEISRAVYVDSDGEARSCVLEDLALLAVEARVESADEFERTYAELVKITNKQEADHRPG